MPACRSARYSAIASEPHMTVSPSRRHGTLPLGENVRNADQFAPTPPSKGTRFTANAMPRSRSSSGRSDHED